MTCIVVLGMHRSGTSLVTNILRTLGVNMGEQFRPPDEWNPDGYWEDLDWRNLNQLIIKRNGHSWYNLPDPEVVSATCDKSSVRVRIKELVKQKDQNPLWGFKDPRTCLTIHALHRHIKSHIIEIPRYILVLRDDKAIVHSLMRRAEGRGYYESPDHWTWLSAAYVQRATRFLEDVVSPVYIVRYESLVAKESAPWIIQALADFVGCANIALMEQAQSLIRFKTWLDESKAV